MPSFRLLLLHRCFCAVVALALAPQLARSQNTLPQAYESMAREGARQLATEGAATFTTRGHPKAHGLDLTLDYPRTWESTDSAPASVVRSFVPVGGGGFAVALSCEPLNLPAGEVLTPEKEEAILSLSGIRPYIGSAASFIDTNIARIDGHPAFVADYTHPMKVDGDPGFVMSTAYCFILQGRLVIFEAYITGRDKAHLARQYATPRMLGQLRLFHAMALTLRTGGTAAGPAIGPAAQAQAQPQTQAAAAAATAPLSPAAAAAIGSPQLRAAYPDSRAPLTKTFDTTGHPRAKGVSISFSYPSTWTFDEETQAPSLIQGFMFPGTLDHLSVVVSPITLPAGASPTLEELEQNVLSIEKQTARLMPEETVLNSQIVRVAGRPACLLEYTTRVGGGSGIDTMRTLQYAFIQGTTVIYFSCYVGAADTARLALLHTHMDEMRSMFQRMVDSIVVHGRPPAATGPATTTTTAAAATGPAAAAFPESRAPLTQTFTTAAHPRARGLHLSLQYPTGWVARDVDFGTLIQVFSCPGTQDFATLDFIPAGADAQQQLDAVLNVYGYMDYVPKGCQFEDGGATTLHGKPAAMIIYSRSQTTAGRTEHSRKIRYIFVHGSTIIHLTGDVTTTDPAQAPHLAAHLEELRPTFQAMAESITYSGEGGGSSTRVSSAGTSSSATASASKAASDPARLRAAFPDSRAPLSQTFSTAAHASTKGVNFTLNYPGTWKVIDNGDIDTSFFCPGTYDDVALEIFPAAANAQEELDKALDLRDYQKLVPEGSQIVDGVAITLRGRRAAMVTTSSSYSMSDGHEAQDLKVHCTLAHGSHQVRLVGHIFAAKSADLPLLPAHLEEMKPFFLSMAESIAFEGDTASARTPAEGDNGSARTPATPFQQFLWTFFSLTLLGTALPFGYCLWKDRQLGRYYTLPRLPYIGLFAATSGLLVLIMQILEWTRLSSFNGFLSGIVIPLAYVGMRRMVDLGWSRWSILIGLPGILDFARITQAPLFSFSLLAYIIFMFVPGRRRTQGELEAAATAAAKAQAAKAARAAKAAAKKAPPPPRTKAPLPHQAGPQPQPTGSVIKLPPYPGQPPHTQAPTQAPAQAPTQPQPAPEPPPTPAEQPAITLWQAGGTYGPYTPREVIALWDSGQIAGSASYWQEDLPEYRPLAPDISHLRTLAS